jgi:hypothetical protein
MATTDADVATENPARQNKWKRDRDEAVADAVWQNEKEERDRVCRIALAHTAAID